MKKTVIYDSGVSVTLQNLTSFAAYEYRKIIVKHVSYPKRCPFWGLCVYRSKQSRLGMKYNIIANQYNLASSFAFISSNIP